MNREEAKRRATELVDQMTVEEMASQLRFDAPAIPRLDIPEYNWWNEGLHGYARSGTATMFPQAIGLGATFDPELMYEVGDVISTEARAKYNESVKHDDRDIYKGLTIWSPNVNLFRDPRWGRGQETYGEDPALISKLGVQFIKGLQGDDENVLKTAACAKHFAVHSGPEAVRHEFNAEVSMKDMFETYLPQFEAAVKEGKVESVMGAYNRTNGEPCNANSFLMEETLRGKWGFEGHYVSDCWAINDFHTHHNFTSSAEESAKIALERGCDVNCGCTYQKIMDAYDAGMIPKELIRRAAIRLFTTRFLLGLFDHTKYDDIPYEVVECKEHLALSVKAASESITMLKNDGILPLDLGEIKRIGVIGPNANDRKSLIGNYHGTASRYITVLEGIQDYVEGDARVYYSEGSHKFLDRIENLAKEGDRLSEVKTVCEHSDVVVLVLGLDETLEGEEGDTGNQYFSGDKDDLFLPASQRALLDTVAETGKPFILVSMTGSAIDLSEASEHANAILQAWYPGALGGAVIAEILFGEKSPSGKLPVTFYGMDNTLPEFTDYSMKNRTYRYMDEAPVYPFGFGLTYGDPYVESVEIEPYAYQDAKERSLTLHVSMKNDGIRTDDVLQVYVHVNGTENEVRNYKLAAFKRLSVGKSCETDIVVPKEAFMTVNEDGEKVLDGSGADIYVSFGQPDALTEKLTGHKAVKLTV